MSVKIGDRVKDGITGQSGIVIGYTYWLFGCERVTIQPEEAKDGKPLDSFCIDAAQCVLVESGAMEGFQPAPVIDSRDTVAAPAGPRRDSRRRPDATR